MPASILVIAPHPDDEVLGCGATIRKYAAGGARVSLCIVTRAYAPDWPEDWVRNRPREVAASAKVLGIADTFFLDFPAVKLDGVPQKELNDALAGVVAKSSPERLYIPHRGDINKDHRLVHEAALVAARPGARSPVREVLAYETLSETEWGLEPFVPNVYEAVTETLGSKLEAMKVYASELKAFPHPRSVEAIEALARKRGSEAGVDAAEAFCLLRSLR